MEINMKLISIHKRQNLSNIEFNHKLFCKITKYSYEKEFVEDSYVEKYSLILSKLQENIGETLIFIDSDSYFAKFDKFPNLTEDIYLQKIDDKNIVDNFLIIKSNNNTIKIFNDVFESLLKQKKADLINKELHLNFPQEVLLKYPYKFEENDVYLNVSVFSNKDAFGVSNIYVKNTFDLIASQPTSYYFAEVLCNKADVKREKKTDSYECINPGKKNALICLYTPEIEQMGLVAEENLSLYCKYHDLTLHMYRDTTPELKKNNISGTWCKPWLLLENFDKHENIAWIDSDILIGKDYKIKFDDEILCFKDPYYPMNAGFMVFKTTEKNKKLLNEVIAEFGHIDGTLEGVYAHGGDQPIFTRKIKEFYPDYCFKANNFGNSHPSIPIHISPEMNDKFIHFMGFPKNFRYHVMDGFSQYLNPKIR